jgi:hypothetical protein
LTSCAIDKLPLATLVKRGLYRKDRIILCDKNDRNVVTLCKGGENLL